MPDYKETEVAGTSWQRCNNVSISNPRNTTPVVRLGEEIVAKFGGMEFTQTAAGIVFDFDPSIVINLRNPETGELIPGATMTGLQIYIGLYSLYIQKAMDRDEASA